MIFIAMISGELISTLLTVIGVIFGIVGVVSKTKNDGKLTSGGLLVISGIIIIGIMTLIKQDNDEKKNTAEKQAAIQEKVRNLILENEHYNTTLNKIDSTLKKAEVLLGQQNDIGANIIRSLNPIEPFQVSIDLGFKIFSDLPNSQIPRNYPPFFATCLAFDRAYVHRSGGAVSLSKSVIGYPGMGLSCLANKKDLFEMPTIDKIRKVFISPECFPYKKMPIFGLQFFIDLREHKKRDSTVHYLMAYRTVKDLPTDSIFYRVAYNCAEDSYDIYFTLTNLTVSDEDRKVKSSLDFRKYASYCLLFMQNMPLGVRFNSIQIDFPPDYSQSMRAELNDHCKYYWWRDSLPSISILTHWANL